MAVVKRKPRARAPRAAPTKPKRKLVRWTDTMDKRLILSIQYVCNERAIVLPWDAIGKHLDVTPGAISQHMAKLRQRLVTWGFGVPPPLRRSSGLGQAANSRAPGKAFDELNFGKGYEMDEYANEDDEELDLKEEYSDEESELEMTRARVEKSDRGEIFEGEEEDEDVKPYTRVKLTQRAHRKRTAVRKGGSDDDLYDPQSEARAQKRSHMRLHRETAFAATRKGRARTISTPEKSTPADTKIRDVEGGKESPSGGVGNADEAKQPRVVDMEDMFSEFSRPIGVNTADSGPLKLGGNLTDPTHSPGRHLGDLKQRPVNEPSTIQDQGNPCNSLDNQEFPHQFSGAAESGLFADWDHNRLVLNPNRPSITSSAHTSSPPTTPTSRVPPNSYANGVIARNVHSPLSSSPLGPAAADHGDISQRIVPVAEMMMQHQHTASTASGFPRQSNDMSLSEINYLMPPSYPHFRISNLATTEAIKQEPGGDPRYDDRNTFGTQFYSGGERTQFDGLDTSSLAEATDPFTSLDLGYGSYLYPEDTLDNYGPQW